jgi:hypothetical protein
MNLCLINYFNEQDLLMKLTDKNQNNEWVIFNNVILIKYLIWYVMINLFY